jgi:hypothetical protein
MSRCVSERSTDEQKKVKRGSKVEKWDIKSENESIDSNVLREIYGADYQHFTPY